MDVNQVIVTGEKETFLARVLVKKIQDAGLTCDFVPWDVDHLKAKWRGVVLVTVYMDDGARPEEEVLAFLMERMKYEDVRLIGVGEKNDIEYLESCVPKEYLRKTFTRPVNNAKFVEAVMLMFDRAAAGDFKKHILIVDDDLNYLNLVRDWLKDIYKVAMANSGLQAIKWLGKNKPDLILLDHEMPVTTGPQVLEMLRSDEDTRSIPVIFLTGKRDKQSVMEVVALKPEGYFLKTIEKDELIMKLEKFFLAGK